MAFSVSGIPVGRGIAIGRAWVLAPASLDVPRRTIERDEGHTEVDRLYTAVRAVDEEFEKMRQDLGKEVAAELRAFLDLQAIVLHDPMLIEATRDRILAEQCNAEWALVQQYELVAEQFDSIEDAYLRERRTDVRQIVERILKAMRNPGGSPRISLPQAAEYLLTFCEAQQLQIDILINNAGFGILDEHVAIDPEKLRQMLQLNVIAVAELCQIFGALK